MGGLPAQRTLGGCKCKAVWVSEVLRGQGYGSRIMQQAEDEARARHCPRVFLETLSFQALPFYEKIGYKVVSQIADFPLGGTCYALTKVLQAE